MTTATLQFNHPTLFRDGRFTREDDPPVTPRPDHATPAHDHAGAAAPASRHAPAEGGPVTLDHVLSAVWDGLTGHHSVSCPVCSGSMTPRYGSGATPVGGRCTRCGSTLG